MPPDVLPAGTPRSAGEGRRAEAPPHDEGGVSFRPARANGRPGAVVYDAEGRVVNFVELDIIDGVVQAIPTVSNPHKLGHPGPVSDVALLPRK